jgi:hypothetical protein
MAVRAWKEFSGKDKMPESESDPDWHEWREFNRTQFEKYVTKYITELHKFNPNLEITSNWMYSSLFPRPVKAPVDFLSGDYTPLDSVNTARFEARYMSSTGMPWDLMAWGFNFPAWADPFVHKPAVQLKQEAAAVISQGGGVSVYYQPTRSGWVDDSIINVMLETAKFCRSRQAVSHRTESVPQVAVLLSTDTYFEKTKKLGFSGDSYDSIKGVLHTLVESHYSVDVAAEHQLTDKLSRYPVVVVTGVTKINDKFIKELVGYANNGGNLVLVDAQTVNLFKHVLNVRLTGSATETVSYIKSAGLLVPVKGAWQDVDPLKTSVISRRYAACDARTPLATPAATVTKTGRGKIVAVYGPVGLNYFQSHTCQVRGFISDVMKTVFPKPLVEVDGPSTVELVLRKKDNKLLVHLINTAGMPTASVVNNAQYSNFINIDDVPKTGKLKLHVNLGNKHSKIYAVPDNTITKIKRSKNNTVEIKLSGFDIHCVIVVE